MKIDRMSNWLSVGIEQELKTALSVKEAEKVEVQKELHELQIRSRDISGPVGLHLHDIDHDVVQNIIEDMEAHRIGTPFPTPLHLPMPPNACIETAHHAPFLILKYLLNIAE